MSTVLDEIVVDTRLRINYERTVRPFPEVIEGSRIRPRRTGFPFLRNLEADGMSFICEVKKASPSKGVIAEEFDYLGIAEEYEEAGAAAISVLTEPKYFRGRYEYLEEIADTVSTPVLMKDFIIDEYQIYHAKELGASAVLLIASVLDDTALEDYRLLAESMGMNALVEVHDRNEAERAVSSGASIIGVNNRDLKTFKVDLGNSIALRDAIPDSVVAVSESGIRTGADVSRLRDAGFDGVLVGEAFMVSPDKRSTMEALRG